MRYDEWLKQLAAVRGKSTDELEETYGDMVRDMFSFGDSVAHANVLLTGEDDEFEGRDRNYDQG